MQIPHFCLSFDPGGSSKTWAYSVSALQDGKFTVLESGFCPVVEEIARPDFTALSVFRSRLLDTYKGTFDLVAERFMSRGFVSYLMELVGFHLGWWANGWSSGQVRFIMPAQWKKHLKKIPMQAPVRYDNWWEEYWSPLLPAAEYKKKTVHVQDAVAMAYWYFTKELKMNVSPLPKEYNAA